MSDASLGESRAHIRSPAEAGWAKKLYDVKPSGGSSKPRIPAADTAYLAEGPVPRP